MKISMVIPCYNSEKTIKTVVHNIIAIFMSTGYDYEIVLVNDCSPDNTWQIIRALVNNDNRIKGINLSKNAGQQAAIMAGLRETTGDLIMSCDDDGQTPIENIPEMVRLLEEKNYDCVCAKYTGFEQKSILRRLGSAIYMRLVYWLIDCPSGIEVRVFMVVRRYVIEEICKYTQPYPIIAGLLLRVTHNIGNLEMQQHSRKVGRSGYTLWKLVTTFLNSFISFSIKPLRLSAVVGGVSALGGMIFGIVVIIRKIVYPGIQAGWSSLMAVLFIMSGLILTVLGMTGEYLGRTYMSATHLPQYVIKETINVEEKNDV